MENKKEYSKPESVIINIEPENIIATSPTFSVEGDHDGGAAGARKRGFWNE